MDEDLSLRIGAALRRQGLDAMSVHEISKTGMADKGQLAFAASDQRCLVTKNASDFSQLGQEALRNLEPHAGIVLCPSSFTGQEIGAITCALVRLAQRYPRGLGQYDVLYLT